MLSSSFLWFAQIYYVWYFLINMLRNSVGQTDKPGHPPLYTDQPPPRTRHKCIDLRTSKYEQEDLNLNLCFGDIVHQHFLLKWKYTK